MTDTTSYNGIRSFMKNLIAAIISLCLIACGSSSDDISSSGSINSLPTTLTVNIEMDPSVEEGVDAFATFELNGEEIMVAISKSVGSNAGIDIDNDFSGKVEITLSSEHEISNEFMKVYSISKVKKL